MNAKTAEPVEIAEIFASVQGESTHAGRLSAFVRLAGCPFACRWCDTAWARGSGARMQVAEVLARVAAIGLPLVELTGGEPLAQAGCRGLAASLVAAGYEVLLETSGLLPWDGLDPRVRVIADLKCPWSGQSDLARLHDLARLRATDELKIVAADRADFDWARARLGGELARIEATVLWSAAEGHLHPGQLADWLLAERPPGRLQVQLHRVLWPERLRGV
jgi:7-carboxy-7-deazaguanine synthase